MKKSAPVILFLTFSKRSVDRYYGDPSVIYRCFNTSSALRRFGFKSFVCHINALPKNIDPDIVVFHRPNHGPALQKALTKYKQAVHLCDFDDLLFDDSEIDLHPAVLSKKSSKQAVLSQINRYREALECFNYFSLSSEVLERRMRSIMSKAHTLVYLNSLDPDWLAHGDKLKPVAHGNSKVISYFSGTANHQSDLESIETFLDQYVARNQNIRIRIFGDVKPNNIKNQSHWDRIDYLPFYELPKYIRESWLAIAPLEQSVFNSCKSAIKFLEAGAFGVPLLASPLRAFRRYENEGLRIVREDSWLDELAQFEDEEYYQFASESAVNVARVALTDESVQRLVKWIGNVL